MNEKTGYSLLDTLRPFIRFYHPIDKTLNPDDAPVPEIALHENILIERPDDENTLTGELEHCPAANYLLGLKSNASRRSQAAQLRRIAHLVGAWDWHLVDWAGIRERAFQRIMSAMMNSSLSPASFNSARAALRGTLKTGTLIGVVDSDVYRHCQDLIGRLQNNHQVEAGRYISISEQKAAMRALQKNSPEHAAERNMAILRLALDLGLRRSEIANLKTGHLDLDLELLKVSGKGGKTRFMHLTQESLDAINDWLAIRGSWPGPIFCRIYKSGKQARTGVSAQAIYNIIELASSGLPTGFSPHDCRRTFVSDVIDATGDLSIAQELAGHSSVSTTTLYDRRGSKARRKAMARLSEYRQEMTEDDDR